MAKRKKQKKSSNKKNSRNSQTTSKKGAQNSKANKATKNDINTPSKLPKNENENWKKKKTQITENNSSSDKQKKEDNYNKSNSESKNEKSLFPNSFPFWARLKIGKKRTTLVIDEAPAMDKKTKKEVDGYVHREAIHTEKKDYEKIDPNPDPNDKNPMYLKRPSKLPKKLFKPHNKDLNMPDHLKEKYSKNNNKNKEK